MNQNSTSRFRPPVLVLPLFCFLGRFISGQNVPCSAKGNLDGTLRVTRNSTLNSALNGTLNGALNGTLSTAISTVQTCSQRHRLLTVLLLVFQRYSQRTKNLDGTIKQKPDRLTFPFPSHEPPRSRHGCFFLGITRGLQALPDALPHLSRVF